MVEYIFKIFKDVKFENGSGWMNKVDVRKKNNKFFVQIM